MVFIYYEFIFKRLEEAVHFYSEITNRGGNQPDAAAKKRKLSIGFPFFLQNNNGISTIRVLFV